jgi:hypothetical protein
MMPRAARLLLLLGAVAAAPRRRLGDALDLERLRRLAANGEIGTSIRFKLDAQSPRHKARDALVAKVAASIACEIPARRVFRDAGVREAAHVAAGLDLWFAVECAKETNGTWAKLEAFLARDAASHTGVAYVEPALPVKLS